MTLMQLTWPSSSGWSRFPGTWPGLAQSKAASTSLSQNYPLSATVGSQGLSSSMASALQPVLTRRWYCAPPLNLGRAMVLLISTKLSGAPDLCPLEGGSGLGSLRAVTSKTSGSHLLPLSFQGLLWTAPGFPQRPTQAVICSAQGPEDPACFRPD